MDMPGIPSSLVVQKVMESWSLFGIKLNMELDGVKKNSRDRIIQFDYLTKILRKLTGYCNSEVVSKMDKLSFNLGISSLVTSISAAGHKC